MNEEEEVEEALRRQDEAMALLERLRIQEPTAQDAGDLPGGGRREGRRWPAPEGATVELHDGERWQIIPASDLGIGGARVTSTPPWLQGPAPARLKGPTGYAVLVLADLMWRDGSAGVAGLRFEFSDVEERDQWTAILIDALLAQYAVG